MITAVPVVVASCQRSLPEILRRSASRKVPGFGGGLVGAVGVMASPLHQLRHLREIRRHAPCFVLGQRFAAERRLGSSSK
jgi:hypothetical protein